MPFEDEFRSHLESFKTAPFLFVGSGFTKRYAQTEDWVGLLRNVAARTGKKYEQYSSDADGDYTKIATAIADDFHDLWWASDDFAEQRAAHPAPEKRSSPMKIEIASHFTEVVASLPESGELNDELEALRVAVVEGIITTNYDGVLEYVFPEFTPFVGQDELLFSDPFGVAEIYKIHGSCTAPESLVITESDFERFNERNPYLAAKLLTVFVEHPVIFIGYSLTDENVRSIIASIASILTRKNIDQLKDRLIFVSWDKDASEPSITPSNFPIGGMSIPIQLVRASSFLEIFEVLGTLRRRFPARILRHLKSEVYELVRTSKPSKTVVVSDLESDSDVGAVDMVIGVGIVQRLANQGIVGLKRRHLLEDVLKETLPTEQHESIVQEVLPNVTNTRTHAPIYRYLRGAGYLDSDGSLVENAKVPARVRAKVRLGSKPLMPTRGYFANRADRIRGLHPTLEDLVANASLSDALLTIPTLDPAAIDTEALRSFLLEHVGVLDDGKLSDSTSWVKCICFYDFLVNRTGPDAKQPKVRSRPAPKPAKP